jgi:hypothetical protein
MLNTPNPKIEKPLTLLVRVDASPAYLDRAWPFSCGPRARLLLRVETRRLSMRRPPSRKEPSKMSKMRTAGSRRNQPRVYRTPPHPLAWGITGNHVYPINDLRKHSLRDCWCRPVDDDGVIVHNSLDGREQYQTGERKLS